MTMQNKQTPTLNNIINLLKYKDFIPQGLMTLLYKKKEVELEEFIELVNTYMEENEINFLFEKIKQEDGIDLDKINYKKEISLFKSIPSDNNSNTDNENEISKIRFLVDKDKIFLDTKEETTEESSPEKKEINTEKIDKIKQVQVKEKNIKDIIIESKDF